MAIWFDGGPFSSELTRVGCASTRLDIAVVTLRAAYLTLLEVAFRELMHCRG